MQGTVHTLHYVDLKCTAKSTVHTVPSVHYKICRAQGTVHTAQSVHYTIDAQHSSIYNTHHKQFALQCTEHGIHCNSDQRIVILPANKNRNRFAEPTSVQIGIGIVREFKNLRIAIGIIFVRWEVFTNNSRIPDISFSQKKC